MTVATFAQPDYTSNTQLGTTYPVNIDAAIKVLSEMGQDFAPHQAASANLTVLIDAGKIIKADGTLVEQSQQTATFTAPSANPRIDRIVIDMLTGAYSIIAGTEAASPTAPAITAGKLPCAQVSLSVGQTQITNANITDERTAFANYDARYASLSGNNTFAGTQSSTKACASGYTRVGPNLCMMDGTMAMPRSSTTSAACYQTNALAGVTDAKAVLINVTVDAVSANAVGQRFGRVIFKDPADTNCMGSTIAEHRVDSYEFVAVTAGTVIAKGGATFILPCTSTGRVALQKTNGSIATVDVMGYFD